MDRRLASRRRHICSCTRLVHALLEVSQHAERDPEDAVVVGERTLVVLHQPDLPLQRHRVAVSRARRHRDAEHVLAPVLDRLLHRVDRLSHHLGGGLPLLQRAHEEVDLLARLHLVELVERLPAATDDVREDPRLRIRRSPAKRLQHVDRRRSDAEPALHRAASRDREPHDLEQVGLRATSLNHRRLKRLVRLGVVRKPADALCGLPAQRGERPRALAHRAADVLPSGDVERGDADAGQLELALPIHHRARGVDEPLRPPNQRRRGGIEDAQHDAGSEVAAEHREPEVLFWRRFLLRGLRERGDLRVDATLCRKHGAHGRRGVAARLARARHRRAVDHAHLAQRGPPEALVVVLHRSRRRAVRALHPAHVDRQPGQRRAKALLDPRRQPAELLPERPQLTPNPRQIRRVNLEFGADAVVGHLGFAASMSASFARFAAATI